MTETGTTGGLVVRITCVGSHPLCVGFSPRSEDASTRRGPERLPGACEKGSKVRKLVSRTTRATTQPELLAALRQLCECKEYNSRRLSQAQVSV